LGCDHYIILESDGRRGGLLTLWRKEVVIQLNGVSKYFIDVVVRDGDEWRLIGVYGEPSWDHKDQTWGALCSLHGSSSLPWLALGDFNEILFHHEKEGGRARLRDIYKHSKMLWRTVVLQTLVIPETFSPGKGGKIRERLDRGVANPEWNIMFPNARLVNGKMVKSDHRPLTVNMDFLGGANEQLHRSPK
jgi:hypothetical protein